MYEYIKGILIEKRKNAIVLEANGIGYYIFSSRYSIDSLEEGNSYKIFLNFKVREDAQEFYGFTTEDERSLFELLISVSGIGSKLALEMLSTFPYRELGELIVTENISLLSTISGLGKKKIQKVILEIKDKIALDVTRKYNKDTGKDIYDALISLGYDKNSIKDNMSNYDSVEDGVKDMVLKLTKF